MPPKRSTLEPWPARPNLRLGTIGIGGVSKQFRSSVCSFLPFFTMIPAVRAADDGRTMTLINFEPEKWGHVTVDHESNSPFRFSTDPLPSEGVRGTTQCHAATLTMKWPTLGLSTVFLNRKFSLSAPIKIAVLELRDPPDSRVNGTLNRGKASRQSRIKVVRVKETRV